MQSLQLRSQFESILKNYKPSAEALALLKETPLVLMAGLTASGRNTVIEYLVRTQKYRFVKSDTTRQPRIIHGKLEENGGPYWFKTEEEFLSGLRQHDYLEAAIIHNQQVSGINISEIQAAKSEGHIAVTEVTPDGIDTILKYKPDTKCLFFLPPSYDVWIDRLKQRGAMSPEELERRKQSAREEIEDLLTHKKYQIIVNEQIDLTVEKVREVIESGVYTEQDDAIGRKVAKAIRGDLN